MLKTLSIVNYALIEKLEIDFTSGFSVITGETGAGKSIILGALSLILGSRADLSVLRDKSKKCIIEGVFDNGKLQIKEFFINNDLDYENQTIIRRELLPSGKSRAFINDSPVSLKLITYLGNKFLNIHSQHQTLQLQDSSFQLEVLDDFINKPNVISQYKSDFSTYHKLVIRLSELVDINNQAKKDEDYFKYQFEELSDATLDVDRVKELEERARFLEHAEEIKIALADADSILNGDEYALIGNLANLTKTLGKIQSYLAGAGELTDRLRSLLIELEDIAVEIDSLNRDEDFDPVELELVNDKLNSVYRLFQKHHVSTVEGLIELKNEYDEKLQNINSLDNEIENTKKELAVQEKVVAQGADELHKIRTSISNNFSDSVLKIITQLGMKDAGFAVKIEKSPSFTSSGVDKVQFLFNANLGVEKGEISKIASGGELSRLMLAVKSLINQQQMLPTVIFDEIDSGVSGDIAGKVGSIIKKMATNHQVITITHLPQIASKADFHYKVYKQSTNNSTITTISLLSKEGRVEELATMLSSENVTETALNVARELLAE